MFHSSCLETAVQDAVLASLTLFLALGLVCFVLSALLCAMAAATFRTLFPVKSSAWHDRPFV